MSAAVAHLARRGFEAAMGPDAPFSNVAVEKGDGNVEVHIPAWGIVILVLTGLTFLFSMFVIKYTYAGIVAALTVVETPTPEVYVAVDSIENEDPANKKPTHTDPLVDDPEVVVTKAKPVTSSIRSTMVQLRAKGGFWSPFRGLGLFICWGLARTFIIAFLGGRGLMRHPVWTAGVSVLADVLLSNWEMTWYHIVISQPSPKRWPQRVPSHLKYWRRMAPAVALRSIASEITVTFPVLLGCSFGMLRQLDDAAHNGRAQEHPWTLLINSLVVLVSGVALFILIQIPATVTAVRVAASMLPEEDETIVPFDRSFGGKTTPEIVGGQGKIGIVEAWRSFDWSSRIRLLKLAAKVVAIMAFVWIVFTTVAVTEVYLILGKAFRAALENAQKGN
ncbi:MAG: hypothetical protein Q9227_001858 [Pyrenula ochraceoflavens]